MAVGTSPSVFVAPLVFIVHAKFAGGLELNILLKVNQVLTFFFKFMLLDNVICLGEIFVVGFDSGEVVKHKIRAMMDEIIS